MAVQAATEVLNLAEAKIRAAIRYYGAYPEETDALDAWLRRPDAASRPEEDWLRP